MSPITIYLHDSGDWVTDWYGRIHHINFNPTDDLSFASLGILDKAAVRFEVNPRGVILSVYNNATLEPLSKLTIPTNHSLHRELNVGHPL